jgi:hypothetical protein
MGSRAFAATEEGDGAGRRLAALTRLVEPAVETLEAGMSSATAGMR